KEIRIGNVRREEQIQIDRSGDFNILGQRIRAVDQDVIALLDRSLIHRTVDTERAVRRDSTSATAMTAVCRSRKTRVVNILIGRLLQRYLLAQLAVAHSCIRLAVAVEKEPCGFGPRKWPFLLVTPDVFTHDVDPDRSFLIETVLDALQMIVI